MLISLNSEIEGYGGEWNELIDLLKQLAEPIEYLKTEEQDLINSINDKKLEVEKLGQQISKIDMVIKK